MAMRVKDRELLVFLDSLPANVEKKKITTTAQLKTILAAVGDTIDADALTLQDELQRSNTRIQKLVNEAKLGVTPSERSDLMALLASDSIELTANVRMHLQALVGTDILVTGDSLSQLTGQIDTNSDVLAQNLSLLPFENDVFALPEKIASSDADGNFTGLMPSSSVRETREGDILNVSTGDGSASIQFEARAIDPSSADITNAALNLTRVSLQKKSEGVYELQYAGPIGEPGAVVEYYNEQQRYAERTQIGADGKFPPDFLIRGRPEQKIVFAVTDGTNDPFLVDRSAGSLLIPADKTGGVDLFDPPPFPGHEGIEKRRFKAATVIDGATSSDVGQGALGDCFVPASWGALIDPLKDIVDRVIERRTGADGQEEWVGHFYKPSWTGPYEKVTTQATDSDLYVRPDGVPKYMRNRTTPNTVDEMELHAAMFEKLYAMFKGGYDVLGQGGIPGEVMSAVLGQHYDFIAVTNDRIEKIWDTLKQGTDQGWPMTGGTYDDAARYIGTGMHENHAYTIKGVTIDPTTGERRVTLRNPWGMGEPEGDGVDDGVYSIPFAKFADLIEVVNLVRLDGSGGGNVAPQQRALHASGEPMQSDVAQGGLGELFGSGYSRLKGLWQTAHDVLSDVISDDGILGSDTLFGRLTHAQRRLLGVAHEIRDTSNAAAVIGDWLKENYGDVRTASSATLLQARKDLQTLLHMAGDRTSFEGATKRVIVERFGAIRQSDVGQFIAAYGENLRKIAAEKAKRSARPEMMGQ